MIITIDGPAGTGKSTVARLVAERLGFLYFDTGAMYRSLTYLMLQKNMTIEEGEALERLLNEFDYDIRKKGEQSRYFVGGQDVTEAIRLPEVTKRVSEVSQLKAVRGHLLKVQRQLGARGNAVFEGRDMGSVVFAQADLKIFLTATPTVRAERRFLEVKDKFAHQTREEILKEIERRDHLDSTRILAPLKQPEGAYLIDTSELTIEEVVNRVVGYAST